MFPHSAFGNDPARAIENPIRPGRKLWERPQVYHLRTNEAEAGASSTVSDSGSNHMS
jgi:hypothetical protein